MNTVEIVSTSCPDGIERTNRLESSKPDFVRSIHLTCALGRNHPARRGAFGPKKVLPGGRFGASRILHRGCGGVRHFQSSYVQYGYGSCNHLRTERSGQDMASPPHPAALGRSACDLLFASVEGTLPGFCSAVVHARWSTWHFRDSSVLGGGIIRLGRVEVQQLPFERPLPLPACLSEIWARAASFQPRLLDRGRQGSPAGGSILPGTLGWFSLWIALRTG